MNQHIKDYNYIIKLCPEIAIWNQVIELMEPDTLYNFLIAFPVMKLFVDVISPPEFLGCYHGEITFSIISCSYTFVEISENFDRLPIYEYHNTYKKFRLLIKGEHLLIIHDRIYWVDGDGGIAEINSISLSKANFHIDYRLFIGAMRKYRNVSEDFLVELQTNYDDLEDYVSPEKFLESL